MRKLEDDHEAAAMTEEERDSHRVKVFQVSRQMVLHILNGQVWTHDFITLPKIENIPSTGRIEAIWDDHSSRCLHLLVRDRSFDIVPVGVAPPVVPGLTVVEHVEVFKRQKDGSYIPTRKPLT